MQRHHRGRRWSTPYARPTRRASRCSCSAAAATCVVADDGFAGTVVEVAHPRRRADHEATTDLRRRRRDRRRRGVLGRPGRPRRRASGWVGVEALSGIPGSGRRHPDPERRRLRPGGLRHHRLGAGLGPRERRGAHLRRRRLRLRLPHQPVQGRARAVRRPRGHLPAPAGRPGRPGAPTPSWRAPSASSPAAGPRWRRSASAVLGLRRGKGMVLDAAGPRHLERRLVLHQPGASPPSAGCPRAPRPGRSPTAGSRPAPPG